MTFDETFNDWNVLVAKSAGRKTIHKYEIIELLDKGIMPTPQALPFLAKVINNDIQLTKPKTREINRPENWLLKQHAVLFYLVRHEELENNNTNKKAATGALTPREQALEETANQYQVSTRSIEKYVQEQRGKLLRALAAPNEKP